jgi:hypothetical protein
MSDPTPTIVTMMKVCPNHAGSFDCNPFCRICEGNQEYESNGYLPCNRFGECGEHIEEDIWKEELGFCLDCSNLYWNHKLDLYLEEIE